MKAVIMGFGLTIIFILTMAIHSNITTESIRAEELDTIINTAIDQTMEVVKDERYSIPDANAFISEFNSNLLLLSNSNSSFTVKVYSADPEKGLLDVEVIETFQYSTGQTGTVKNRKTILLDTILD